MYLQPRNQKANHIWGCIQSSVASRSSKVILPFCPSIYRETSPQSAACSSGVPRIGRTCFCWTMPWEGPQRRCRGLQHISYEPREVGLSSLENRRLQKATQYFWETWKKNGDRPIRRACSYRTRGNGFKIKESRFRLCKRKMSFSLRLLRHSNRLPREAIILSVPGSVSGQIGLGSEQLGLVEDVLAKCRAGWIRESLQVPSNSNHSVIVWFLQCLQLRR